MQPRPSQLAARRDCDCTTERSEPFQAPSLRAIAVAYLPDRISDANSLSNAVAGTYSSGIPTISHAAISSSVVRLEGRAWSSIVTRLNLSQGDLAARFRHGRRSYHAPRRRCPTVILDGERPRFAVTRAQYVIVDSLRHIRRRIETTAARRSLLPRRRAKETIESLAKVK